MTTIGTVPTAHAHDDHDDHDDHSYLSGRVYSTIDSRLLIPHKEGEEEETSEVVKLELRKHLNIAKLGLHAGKNATEKGEETAEQCEARLRWQREIDRGRRAQARSQETAEQREVRLVLRRQQDRARRTQLSREATELCPFPSN